MYKIHRLIFFPAVWLLFIGFAQGQDLFLFGTAGTMSTDGNLYLSYSVGEPCIQETLNGNTWITEGFQQPESIHLMVGINETNTLNDVRIFPNPTSSAIFITGIETDQPFEVQLINMFGQILFAQEYHPQSELKLGVERFPPGLYLILISTHSTTLFSQSILKI